MTLKRAAENLAYYYELKAQRAKKLHLRDRYTDLALRWRRKVELLQEG